ADTWAARVRGLFVFIEPHPYRDGGLLTVHYLEDKGVLTEALESRPEVWGIVRRPDRVVPSPSLTITTKSSIEDVVSEFEWALGPLEASLVPKPIDADCKISVRSPGDFPTLEPLTAPVAPGNILLGSQRTTECPIGRAP